MEKIAGSIFIIMLFTPLGLLLGVVLWLIGFLQKGSIQDKTNTKRLGLKFMFGSLLVFVVGWGTCAGLAELQSLFEH